MNKFLKLTQLLVRNKLWFSELEYFKIKTITNVISDQAEIEFSTKLKVVVKTVDKSFIDNVNILSTDLSFVIDFASLNFEPKTGDLVKLNETKYKVILCKPLGIINNTPTAMEIVIRLA
jgi:hypothetical protein